MVNRLAVVLVCALLLSLLQPAMSFQRAYASEEVVKYANKDVFVDLYGTYPNGLQANIFIPGAQNVNVNVVGPDYDVSDQKTAINFSNLNSGLSGSISKVVLRVFIPYIYTNNSTDDVRATVTGSDNTTWLENLSNNPNNFPVSNGDYRLSSLQNILVASNTGIVNTTNVDTTSPGCAPIANTLVGCLNFDVTDYVKNKLSTGAIDVTFMLTGRLGTNNTAYFTIYPRENSTYGPQLIFTEADTTPPVVSGVTEGGLYNTNRTVTFDEGSAMLDGSAFTSGSVVSSEGAHTLIVTDSNNNTTTVHFTIDKTAPAVTGAANGLSYNSNRTITFSDGTATLDGSAFTSGSTVSAEGAHTLVATDAAGNARTIFFIIDKTAPIVSGVTNGGLYNANRTIAINEGTATLNGSAFTSGSTVSAEGTYNLTVTDAAGNSTIVSFTIDKTAPTVTGVTNGLSYNSNRTITLSDGTATLNGSLFTSGSTVSAEGSHTLIVTDTAGNTRTIAFTIDKTAPIVNGVTNGRSYTTDKSITFNEGTATLNGAAFLSGSTVSEERTHTLAVTDAASNTTTMNFTIDKTAPTVTGVTHGASYNSNLTITISEGTATLNGSAFTSGSTVNAEGLYTLIVTDTAGNVTMLSFIIDKTVPVVTGVLDGASYNSDQTITFNEGTATLNGSAFASGSTVSEERGHTLNVIDAAGNTTTVNFTIDKTGPTVTGISNGTSYSSNRTITFSDGTATLNGSAFTSSSTVSAEGSYTLTVTDLAGNVTTLSFTIDKTAPVVIGAADGQWYSDNKIITFNEGTATLNGSAFTSGTRVSDEGSHILIVTDAAGNVTTVNFSLDKTAPVVSGVANGGTYAVDKTITFNEGTATLAGASFTSGNTVSAEGSYTLIVTDAAGNVTTVNFAIDRTAPVVSGVTNNGSYMNDRTITFNEGTATLDGTPFTSGSTVRSEGTHTLVVTDAAGNATTVQFSITTPVYPSDGGSGVSDPNSTRIVLNGVIQEQLTVKITTKTAADGSKQSIITVDEAKLNALLDKADKQSVVTIPITVDTNNQVIFELNGQTVKNMENREIVLQVQTKAASYTIPAEQMNVDRISSLLGGNIERKDIVVKIEITKLSNDDPAVIVQKQKNNNVEMVAPTIEFKLTGHYNGKQAEMNQFNAYVERTIAVPAGVNPEKITTGVVAMPDGTFAHVPTKVIQQDGRYYVVISSLTNSMYSVVYNNKSFADVEHHWSNEIVNEMGARLILSGVDETNFAPDKAITRAEFTAIIIRALGLRDSNNTMSYADVTQNDWFYSAVSIAQRYGLIQGYSQSEFGPNKPISRQEAMVIIERALKLAGHDQPLLETQIEAQLEAFNDSGQFAYWSQGAAALCAKLSIMEGSNGLARPTHNITRAETAAVVKRMLEAADFI
ncbi:S-layer homology domain-containing protein [Paenibacillus sp. M.A.Huq-81]